ncbi:DDE family transposase [Paralcaligenes ureilyticus]|uniref:DDE family transposase n=1 Tax=Paralcaligenes ureilyticus TaxID=627131 RepID=A0A4R3M930_9BURK|nr:DDE family transposase [Paralcaligenes ureilyticus]
MKLHTLLDLRGNIPTFIHISDGKVHDVNVLDLLPLEVPALFATDRRYLDFSRLYTLHQAGAFFVTRAKRNMKAHRLYSAPTDRVAGVIRDQLLRWTGTTVPTATPSCCDASASKHPILAKPWCF